MLRFGNKDPKVKAKVKLSIEMRDVFKCKCSFLCVTVVEIVRRKNRSQTSCKGTPKVAWSSKTVVLVRREAPFGRS